MRKRLALSLFSLLLAAMPYAHSQTTTGDTSQGQGQSVDCSDPMNAMTSACGSDLSQQGQYGLGNYGQTGQTGERNVPAGAPLNTRTYTDLGTPTTTPN